MTDQDKKKLQEAISIIKKLMEDEYVRTKLMNREIGAFDTLIQSARSLLSGDQEMICRTCRSFSKQQLDILSGECFASEEEIVRTIMETCIFMDVSQARKIAKALSSIPQQLSEYEKRKQCPYCSNQSVMCMDCGKTFKVKDMSKHEKECPNSHWIIPERSNTNLTPEQKAEKDANFNKFISDQKKGLIPGRFNPVPRQLATEEEIEKIVDYFKDNKCPYGINWCENEQMPREPNSIGTCDYCGKPICLKTLDEVLVDKISNPVDDPTYCTHCGFEMKFHKCNPHKKTLLERDDMKPNYGERDR
jgi:hypothetical protein